MNEVPRAAPHAGSPVRRRVLIVDDTKDVATTLAALIELLGHDVRVSTDARDVLPILDDFEPDLAFLDISMPEMTGWELARLIREHPRGMEIYLVALTGLGSAADRAYSRECGFDEHWVKPLDIARLMIELGTVRAAHAPRRP